MRAAWILGLLAVAARAGEDDPLAPLLERIAGADAREREQAAVALARERDPRAIAALGATLGDAEERVRVAGAVSLARLRASDARSIGVLVAALRSDAWYTRWQACVALGTIGPAARSAAPALYNAALDGSLDIATEASTAFARVAPQDPDALAQLARILESDQPANRAFLLDTLEAAKRCDLARDWLAQEFRENRHRLGARACGLLAGLGTASVPIFVAAAAHPDATVRAMSIDALARLKATSAAATVFAAVTDESEDVRIAALGAVGKLRPAGGAFAAALALGDASGAVRREAAAALAELKVAEPAAGAGLVRLLGEEGEPARAALKATGFPGLAAFLERTWEEGPERRRLVVVLLRPRAGTPDEAATLAGLESELDDNQHGQRLVAALKETLAREEEALLIGALEAADPLVRCAAAMLLGHLARDRESARAALGRLRHDAHAEVREAVAKALERLR
jgi:HEAT repeat protein